MEDSENKQNSTEAEDANMDICPCCGKRSIPKPAKINADLMDQWLACMVTATPFSHEYPLYGGRIKITVSKLSAEQQDSLRMANAAIVQYTHNKQQDELACDTQELRALLQLLAVIQRIEITKKSGILFRPQDIAMAACSDILAASKHSGESVTETIEEALKRAYGNLTDPSRVSGIPINTLVTVAKAHADLYTILLSNGFDDSFWEGIELA